jgi:hypothetical protein
MVLFLAGPVLVGDGEATGIFGGGRS